MAILTSHGFLPPLPRDPRYGQLAVLSGLAIDGVGWLGFDASGRQIAILLVGSVLAIQYAGDMNGCDPCAAEPLSPKALRRLGVFWLNEPRPEAVPGRGRRPIMPPMGGARDAFVTRMHPCYGAERFPEDFVLRETADRNNFQARYVLRHPWKGEDSACPAREEYRRQVVRRREHEAPSSPVKPAGISIESAPR